jgi:hypothetical protein
VRVVGKRVGNSVQETRGALDLYRSGERNVEMNIARLQPMGYDRTLRGCDAKFRLIALRARIAWKR